MGLVENRFKRFADAAGQDPAEYMADLVAGGATQKALAKRLECTRQAVGRIARKYEVEFPGCEIDIDAVAEEELGMSFQKYVKKHPDERYVDIAETLGISLSTVKRRVKELGLNRRATVAA